MSAIPDHSAYLRSVAPGGDPRALMPWMNTEAARGGAAVEGAADVRGVMDAAHRGDELSPGQIYAVEALIHPDIRPVFDIVNDSYAPVTHSLWLGLNEPAVKARIETAIRASGRVELKTGSTTYGGTGFVVGEGLLMTNRHVAELFALGLGDAGIVFKSGYDPGFDLKRERGKGAGVRLSVSRVRLIHPYWDCALLEVVGLPAAAAALKLSGEPLAALDGREVALVGYPAEDPRNPIEEQDDVLGGGYRIKRLAPGLLSAPAEAASFGKLVMALGHDASTLGGNSGSAVVDLKSGLVVGLHFGGLYKVRNTAAAAVDLAADPRLYDAGVNFEVPRPAAAPTWSDYWSRSFPGQTEAVSAAAPPRPAPVAAATAPAASATTRIGEDGAVTLTIPLKITVSLGAPARPAASAPAVAEEAMTAPWRDQNYENRRGYRPDFIGKTALVPPPAPKDASVLAKTRDGGTELLYENFSIAMAAKRRLALFVASNVTAEPALRRPDPNRDYTRKGLSGLGPNDQELWFADERLDSDFQISDYFYTRDDGAFDKGHLARRDDVAFGATYDALRRANGDSYHLTNCSPQIAAFNRSANGADNWGDLENVVLSQAKSERLCVFAGPVLSPDDPFFLGRAAPRQRMTLQIPTRFWKVVVAQDEKGLATYVLLLEQDLAKMPKPPEGGEEFVLPDNFVKSLVRLKDIEAWSGLAFDKTLHEADQYFTERGVAAANLTGAKLQRRKKD